MASEEKRSAPRIACEIPVRFLRPWGFDDVRMLDASGTGVRLRVSLAALGLEPPADLGRVTDAIGERFGKDFVVEFNPLQLGRLIVRHLRVVRIGHATPEDEHVELGCLLRCPFSREEAAAIGLPLEIPECGEPEAPDAEPQQLPEGDGTVGAPADSLGAIIVPVRTDAPEPLFASVEHVTARGASLRVRELRLSTAADSTVPVAAATAAIRGTLRDQATMQLSRDEVLIWSGPVQIAGLELTDAEGELLLDVAFFRPLSGAALKDLGLLAA